MVCVLCFMGGLVSWIWSKSNDASDAVDNVGLKNELIFYLWVLRYCKVIYFVSHCQNYLETEYGTQRWIRNRNLKKLAVVVHVTQTTQNLVTPRCYFAKDANKFTRYIKVHTATRWTIRHSLMLFLFADLMNVRPVPNVVLLPCRTQMK